MEWQPIETAPKDGTWVILYGDCLGEPRVHSAFWGGIEQNEPNWYGGESSGNSLVHPGYWEPTHWMPLPEPPR